MKSAYLVIDQGGHGTRALVFNTQGDVVISAYAPVTTTHPQTGWYEQSTQDLINSLQQCVQQLSASLATCTLHIHAAALITQRSSLVACYRDSLQAMTPVISWQDTRNSNWLQQQIENGYFNLGQLKQLTGLRLNAHYGASKMRWLLERDHNVQMAAQQDNLIFLPLASFVTHLLTDSRPAVVDAASASRTFLCEFGQEQWSDTLLSLFALPKNCLPTIVASQHHFGTLSVNNQCIPLQVVGGDQSFLPFAYGSETFSSALFINAGTGAFVQTELPLADTPAALLCSLAARHYHQEHGQQNLTVAEGTVNACASALDWLFAQEQHSLAYDAINTALLQVTSPPVFHHRITALGSPYWLPAGESFFSEPIFSGHASSTATAHTFTAHTLEAKTVAVIESIIFLLAINIDLLQQAKPQLRQIFISGGIAQADGFCQKLANCTQLTVIRCANHEASSRGAAFYLANITHYNALDAARTFLPTSDRPLLARYQYFYEWLRNEWMITTH